MKRNYVFALIFSLVWSVILVNFVSAYSQNPKKGCQILAKELCSFDSNDICYDENGVEPAFIVNRRDAADRHSVFSTITDARFRNVRIRSVFLPVIRTIKSFVGIFTANFSKMVFGIMK